MRRADAAGFQKRQVVVQEPSNGESEMKFDCGETASEYFARLEKWHRWFAWYPVRIGYRDCRWLEYVERKITYGFDGWDSFSEREYRAAPNG